MEWKGNHHDEVLNDCLPDLLLDLLSNYDYRHFDAILVNEGQDFCPKW
jgi:hypothetical protein